MRKTNAGPAIRGTHLGLTIALVCITLVVIGSIVILSWVPPISRDALSHHLAVPKLYLQRGAIYEIPDLKFSYYPMNLDLLYLIPLYFGNDILPKYIHFAFALLTAWLIFSYLRKRLNGVWAAGGALFFLSLPVIVKLSITVYVDLGLVFFSTAALMALFKWIESRFKLQYLILSAICCGLALGTKYNGLIVLFLLTAFVPLVYHQRIKLEPGTQEEISDSGVSGRQLRAIGSGVLFGLVALTVFSPWMIRNYVWKSNPVYPLYNRYFNPPVKSPARQPDYGVQNDSDTLAAGQRKRGSSGWGPFALRKVIYGEAWWEIALIPVRIFFQGKDDDPKYFDGKLNPFLFLLPIFAFLRLKDASDPPGVEKKVLLWFAILFILYAYLKIDMRIRYIVPAVPPLIILSVFGFYRVHDFLRRNWLQAREALAHIVALALAAVVFMFNGFYIIHQFKVVDPLSYIGGRVGRDAYITRYRPEYPVLQYVNRHFTAEAKLLVLFMGNRRYYSDRELIFGTNLFRDIVKNSATARAIGQKMRHRGITHLLIRYDLFNQWSDRQFSVAQKMRLKAFFSGEIRQIFSRNGFGLFELTDQKI